LIIKKETASLLFLFFERTLLDRTNGLLFQYTYNLEKKI
jgi:hypothetical protein